MRAVLAVCALLAAAGWLPGAAQEGVTREHPEAARQLLEMANQSRAAAGAAPLKWDAALADAALVHCRKMAAEGEISHRYGGEASVTDRAGAAGAHFSLIEENVAMGSRIESIHDGWMHSPGHRENLLNPQVDRVGIAVVSWNGLYYAVADYARGVAALSQAQVDAAVGRALHAKGILTTEFESRDAKNYCESDGRYGGASQPRFLMRWQNSDATVLPEALLSKLNSSPYSRAAVASCPARNVEGAFTVYRVAVLLY